MLNKFDNFIFDLDGTLINSCEEVLRCFEKAFALSDCPLDKNRLTSDVIGPPLKEIILTLSPGLNEEMTDKITTNFRKIYDFDNEDVSKLYDGVSELITELKQADKKIFLATFKPTIPTERLVKKFFKNVFEDVYTIDKFGKHITKSEMIEDIAARYNLDKEKTVMIGDAPSDVRAGKDAGVTAIGVLWGYGSDKSELIKNSDYTVKTPLEIKGMF